MDKFSSFFLSKLIKTVKDSGLLAWGDRALVAVSGGVDSTVLLYSLYELRHYFGITLACASFDHKIRPSSHEDILFVSGLCKKFSLPFYTGQADAKDYAKRLKLNLEESARILRYNFLMESALDFGAQKIAAAHHLDDFAENFIMRLTVGGGGGAIAGIPVKNNIIIRPLIRHTKQEIINFARDNSIKFREDYTNYDKKIFRNFVRLNIIPQLKKHNKSFLKTVYNTSGVLRSDDEFINAAAKDLFDNISKLFFSKTEGNRLLLSQIVFNRKDLIGSHRALLYRLLKISILSLWQPQDIVDKNIFSKKPIVSYSNFEAFVELVKSKKPNAYFNIKHLISVRREYDNIFIEHILLNNKLTFKSFDFNFTGNGKEIKYKCILNELDKTKYKDVSDIEIKELGRSFFIKKLKEKETYRIKAGILKFKKNTSVPANVAFFDFEKLKFPVAVRTFKEGDRFVPLGAGGHKKVKSYFIDKKVPMKVRKTLPIILFKDEIAWVSFNSISETIKITESTKYAGIMFIK